MAGLVAFNQICAAQNVELRPLLMAADDMRFHGKFSKGPNQSLLQTIVRAGILLREEPGVPLTATNTLLELDAFGDSVPLLALATMCNDSLQPVQSEIIPVLPGPTLEVKGVCGHAEECWIDTIEERRGALTDTPLAENFTHDGEIDGLLIVSRKFAHEQTALSFTEVAINGIRYCEGSLFNLGAVGDEPGKRQWNNIEMPNGFSQRGIGEVACATFLRLSAFALPLEQRAEYGVENLGEGRKLQALRVEASAGATLTYLQQLEAQEAA